MLFNTKSVLNAVLEDIKRIWFVVTLIAEISFILLYAYSIYSNINKLFFLIIYSILFVVSLSAFILHWILYKKHKQEEKIVKKSKRYISYITKIAILVAQVVEMLKFGISDFNKILLIVSVITLVVKILVEIVKIFIEKYADAFAYAFEKDIEPIDPSRWKSNVLKVIDAPLEKLAGMKTGEEKEKTKQELRQEEYNQRYKEAKEERKKAKKHKKEIKRATKKIEEKERVDNEINEIKSHVKEIFSKTDKKIKKVK